jgi:hypothetical protein
MMPESFLTTTAALVRLKWATATCAVVSGALSILTTVWRDWLEVVGMDPDHHSGSAELLIAVALAVVCVALLALRWWLSRPRFAVPSSW